jgi:hypothetical protein
MFPGLDIRPQATTTRPISVAAAQSTLYLNVGSAQYASILLSANVTITLASGLYEGQSLRLSLKQDGAGSRTVAFASNVVFGSDITSFTASTAAGKTDYVGLVWSQAAGVWRFVSYARGF